VCESWEKESLQYLPNILNVIINEAVYSEHRELLEHLLEISWAIGTTSPTQSWHPHDWTANWPLGTQPLLPSTRG
jgi:hypothetical protein